MEMFRYIRCWKYVVYISFAVYTYPNYYCGTSHTSKSRTILYSIFRRSDRYPQILT